MNALQTEIDDSTSLTALARALGVPGEIGLAENWLQVVQDVAGVGIWDWGIDQPTAICTESNLRLYGLPPGTVMPPHDEWLTLVHPDDRLRVCHELDSAVAGVAEYHTEFRVVWPDGTLHWLAGRCRGVCNSTGKTARLIGVNYDITRLKEAEEASRHAAEDLSHQARHDLLTGLPNRRFLDEQLKEAIAHASQFNKMVAVMHIDLDGFKVVNDTLGHAMGDELLRAVSGRLNRCISTSDTLARTGGDEFTVILSAIAERRCAEDVARQILTTLQRRFHVAGHSLYITASIGMSVFPDDAREAGALQQNADVAMYRAKHSTKNAFHFFTAGMIEPLRERLVLETALRTAREKGELSLQYQPIFQVDEGFDRDHSTPAPVGYEALLRWSHPELGPISPARFIPIAEETGLIIPIGTWALERVCQQIRYWYEAGLPHGRVYVNVSGIQFASPDFVDIVARILQATGVQGVNLGLEITESVLMSDVEACSHKIRDLQAIGVSISIDDFGTGYSCLSYLQRIPIDVLKIDGSFVREIGIKPTANALIRGIVSLAHSLHMRVIAECIETEEQLAAVRDAGCDEVQGYLLGRPAAVWALGEEGAIAGAPQPADGLWVSPALVTSANAQPHDPLSKQPCYFGASSGASGVHC